MFSWTKQSDSKQRKGWPAQIVRFVLYFNGCFSTEIDTWRWFPGKETIIFEYLDTITTHQGEYAQSSFVDEWQKRQHSVSMTMQSIK